MFKLRVSSLFRSRNLTSRHFQTLIDIHPEVEEAIHSKKPVVALESTLITHGFDTSESPALALSLENNVRSSGSIPATIAILNGRIKVGLTGQEIEELVATPAVKISRRDIGPAIALKANGGNTVVFLEYSHDTYCFPKEPPSVPPLSSQQRWESRLVPFDQRNASC